MINRLYIKGLYRIYNYDIDFKKNPQLSILTGANGYGKTTVLHIINNIISCKFWYFYLLSFDEIKIYFEDNTHLEIKKSILPNNSQEDDQNDIKLETKFIYFENENTIDSFVINRNDENSLIRWYKATTISNRYRPFSYQDLWNDDKINHYPEMQKKIGKVYMFLKQKTPIFVREQRIFHLPERDEFSDNTIFEINCIADILKEKYSEARMNYSKNSQKIDSTFIQRLIEGGYKIYSEDEYKNVMTLLQKRIDDYKKFGLVSANLYEKYYSDKKSILSLYIDDIKLKMDSYGDFFNRLNLFNSFLSSKGITNKNIQFNEKDGIRVTDKQGYPIPLDRLSSGEQNLIILYYNLSFVVSNNNILLIDEPENSLHVAWQNKMLTDFLKMSELLNCQIIVATHSPSFINGRWDITFDLEDNKYIEESYEA